MSLWRDIGLLAHKFQPLKAHLWTSDLQSRKMINLSCLEPLVCGHWSQQPQGLRHEPLCFQGVAVGHSAWSPEGGGKGDR